jgi:hypothetical protein
MYMKWIFIAVVFLAGLYTTLHYDSNQFKEGFSGKPRCPDILIQDGEGLILKNSKLAEIPGVNPVRFENLEEYVEFVQWQHSQGIRCPVLYYKKVYDAQSHEGYLPLPLPPINVNAYADKPPQGSLTYPAMDPNPQDIGTKSMLNEYHDIGESLPVSANAADTNWGGANFTMKAIDHGQYKGNEVYMKTA